MRIVGTMLLGDNENPRMALLTLLEICEKIIVIKDSQQDYPDLKLDKSIEVHSFVRQQPKSIEGFRDYEMRSLLLDFAKESKCDYCLNVDADEKLWRTARVKNGITEDYLQELTEMDYDIFYFKWLQLWGSWQTYRDDFKEIFGGAREYKGCFFKLSDNLKIINNSKVGHVNCEPAGFTNSAKINDNYLLHYKFLFLEQTKKKLEQQKQYDPNETLGGQNKTAGYMAQLTEPKELKTIGEP